MKPVMVNARILPPPTLVFGKEALVGVHTSCRLSIITHPKDILLPFPVPDGHIAYCRWYLEYGGQAASLIEASWGLGDRDLRA